MVWSIKVKSDLYMCGLPLKDPKHSSRPLNTLGFSSWEPHCEPKETDLCQNGSRGRGKGAILVTLHHNATLFNPGKNAVESIVCNRKAAKFTLGPSMSCLMVCLVLTCHLIVTIANLLIFLTLGTFYQKNIMLTAVSLLQI